MQRGGVKRPRGEESKQSRQKRALVGQHETDRTFPTKTLQPTDSSTARLKPSVRSAGVL